jgi:hypothetical protein
MKKIAIIISMLSLSFIFCGCPYESTVPINTSSMKINPKLLGTWEMQNGKHDTYKVTKMDEFTYAITQINTKEYKEKLLAYESVVNGTSFLNIWEDKVGESKQYSLYKIEMKPDGTVVLAEVTDNIAEHFTSSGQLQEFIAVNMKNSYFFGKDEVKLIRMGN